MRNVLIALGLALAFTLGVHFERDMVLFEDGSYVLPDGRTGCVTGALCDDSTPR